ncbi:riboflavin synthase [Hydrogenothermus marinus]|uniref:Riboflavin synthase n=1 Tax=Hydrogenothermus marinus TaxID=133270 RepID=A0A3M0BQ82_9AQUI|nr:riboflavin synthase [Hydrogenothermus marinus]RMA96988.1 riboflavin synthase alpha chain [Hydrogenothermus marinus]
MFTGLIEEVGKVNQIIPKQDGILLKVNAKKILEDIKLGDSIAVNGVCLTTVDFDNSSVSFEVSKETLKRSNLKNIKTGDFVNLERALKASDRLGGHIVQGHVDTTGTIYQKSKVGEHTELIIEIPLDYTSLVIEKGSIAIDGISLTINYIKSNKIYINIIPHTLENTNLKYKKVGELVNIEFDIFSKYILKFVNSVDINKLKDKKLEELLNEF